MAAKKYSRSPSGPKNPVVHAVISSAGGLSAMTAPFTYPSMRFDDTFVTTLDNPLVGADSQYINWAYMTGGTAAPVPVVAMQSFQGIGGGETRGVRIQVIRGGQ